MADIDVDALRAEVERLRKWKAEAMPVLDGLQELGRALGVPIGRSITARASVDRALDLRNERDAAEAKVRAVESLADEWAAMGTTSVYESAAELAQVLLEATR